MTRKFKSLAEIAELKQQWEADPSWDIEDTPGFEEYSLQLRMYREEKQAQWEEQCKRRLMKESAKSLAFPIFNSDGDYYDLSAGLTKREYFAAKALQGLLANPEFFHASDHRLLPKKAIEAADGLIDLLDQS